jgi:hypothetical protein
MFPSSFIVLNGFLKNIPAQQQVSLLSPLSSQIKEQMELSYTPPIDIIPKKFCKRSIINEVHYSWYIPLIESFPKTDLSLLVYAFDNELKNQIERHFSLTQPSFVPSEVAIDFFQNLVFNKILDSTIDILPKEYLPDTELNILLELSKNELVSLIDYLSVFDLALQIPKIVNPEILKKIDEYLSPDKKLFLKKLAFYKQPFAFPPLPLETISSLEDFNLVLHKRGLNRFAKAICNEHSSFIWYICHKLDIGRGNNLFKLCKDKTQKEITKTITFNIMEIIPIIRNR